MIDCDELRKKLTEFRNNPGPEYELAPIERWMTRQLGVKRRHTSGGSGITYYHKALLNTRNNGFFGVHIIHGKKREFVRRFDFRNYLYRPLSQIIDFIEMEQSDAEERP